MTTREASPNVQIFCPWCDWSAMFRGESTVDSVDFLERRRIQHVQESHPERVTVSQNMRPS